MSARADLHGGRSEMIVPTAHSGNTAGQEISGFRSSGRLTGYTEITRLVARHKMFFGSSKSVRCGLPTIRPELVRNWLEQKPALETCFGLLATVEILSFQVARHSITIPGSPTPG
jgi:hypothetical protein